MPPRNTIKRRGTYTPKTGKYKDQEREWSAEGHLTNKPITGVGDGWYVPPPKGAFTDAHRAALIFAYQGAELAGMKIGDYLDAATVGDKSYDGTFKDDMTIPPDMRALIEEAMGAQARVYGPGFHPQGVGDDTPAGTGGITGGIRSGTGGGRPTVRPVSGGPTPTGGGDPMGTRERTAVPQLPRREDPAYKVRVRPQEMGGAPVIRGGRVYGSDPLRTAASHANFGGPGPTRVNIKQTKGPRDPIEMAMVRNSIRRRILGESNIPAERKVAAGAKMMDEEIQLEAYREQRSNQWREEDRAMMDMYLKRVRELANEELTPGVDGQPGEKRGFDRAAQIAMNEIKMIAPRLYERMNQAQGGANEFGRAVAGSLGRQGESPELGLQRQRVAQGAEHIKIAKQEAWSEFLGKGVLATAQSLGQAQGEMRTGALQAHVAQVQAGLMDFEEGGRWHGDEQKKQQFIRSAVGGLRGGDKLQVLMQIPDTNPAEILGAAEETNLKDLIGEKLAPKLVMGPRGEGTPFRMIIDDLRARAKEAEEAGDAALEMTYRQTFGRLMAKLPPEDVPESMMEKWWQSSLSIGEFFTQPNVLSEIARKGYDGLRQSAQAYMQWERERHAAKMHRMKQPLKKGEVRFSPPQPAAPAAPNSSTASRPPVRRRMSATEELDRMTTGNPHY